MSKGLDMGIRESGVGKVKRLPGWNGRVLGDLALGHCRSNPKT